MFTSEAERSCPTIAITRLLAWLEVKLTIQTYTTSLGEIFQNDKTKKVAYTVKPKPIQ